MNKQTVNTFCHAQCAGGQETDPICRLTEAETLIQRTSALLLAKIKQKPNWKNRTLDDVRTNSNAHTHPKYRRGTGQSANTWETQLTIITKAR